MQTGVSTACLYPMETERSLELLLRMGYRRFEVFFNCMEELGTPFLRELKRRGPFWAVDTLCVGGGGPPGFWGFPPAVPKGLLTFTAGIWRQPLIWEASMW